MQQRIAEIRNRGLLPGRGVQARVWQWEGLLAARARRETGID